MATFELTSKSKQSIKKTKLKLVIIFSKFKTMPLQQLATSCRRFLPKSGNILIEKPFIILF